MTGEFAADFGVNADRRFHMKKQHPCNAIARSAVTEWKHHSRRYTSGVRFTRHSQGPKPVKSKALQKGTYAYSEMYLNSTCPWKQDFKMFLKFLHRAELWEGGGVERNVESTTTDLISGPCFLVTSVSPNPSNSGRENCPRHPNHFLTSPEPSKSLKLQEGLFLNFRGRKIEKTQF